MLNISEVFFSIQGEGPFLGKPCVFVRFSGCNLRCKWGSHLCDTPYTSWEPEQRLRPLDEIVGEVTALDHGSQRVVITGGEPTIHPGLGRLVTALKERGYELHLETNGNGEIPDGIDWVVCSPKLSDSTPADTKHAASHDAQRKKLHPRIDGRDARIFLKFVVGPDTPLEEIAEISAARAFPPERIFLMPLSNSKEELLAAAPMVKALSARTGYSYSGRLHLELWGARRGI